GKVDYVEALGELTILYFKTKGSAPQVLAKLAGIHSNARGNAVRLTADPAKVHLFEGGRSLLYA
ncbi:MAG: ABC transporter ATP-binding protein, partial [Pseudomonadota bacterium]